MLDWLTANWNVVAVIGSIVLEFVILLITKKRPEVIDNSLLIRLCEWINKAEATLKLGPAKMSYVLNEARQYLGDKYVEKDVRKLVEYILTLPEKKEK